MGPWPAVARKRLNIGPAGPVDRQSHRPVRAARACRRPVRSQKKRRNLRCFLLFEKSNRNFTESFRVPPCPNLAPRWPKMSSKMAQHRPRMAPRWRKMAQHRPKMAPRWPNIGPRWPQDGPTWAQHGPKMAQHSSKMAQHSPEMAQLIDATNNNINNINNNNIINNNNHNNHNNNNHHSIAVVVVVLVLALVFLVVLVVLVVVVVLLLLVVVVVLVVAGFVVVETDADDDDDDLLRLMLMMMMMLLLLIPPCTFWPAGPLLGVSPLNNFTVVYFILSDYSTLVYFRVYSISYMLPICVYPLQIVDRFRHIQVFQLSKTNQVTKSSSVPSGHIGVRGCFVATLSCRIAQQDLTRQFHRGSWLV